MTERDLVTRPELAATAKAVEAQIAAVLQRIETHIAACTASSNRLNWIAGGILVAVLGWLIENVLAHYVWVANVPGVHH